MNENAADKELTKDERSAMAMALCKRIACAPRQIFDFQMYVLFNKYYLVPQQVEQLLNKRGIVVKDDESLYDKISELFGDGTAKMMQKLI